MIRTADIRAAMRETYRQPEWALFFEPADGTGAACRRHADAIAMSMYPSRGLSLVGFEFKVSRSDWKREKENPDKAEAIAQFCDNWVVVAPKNLIPLHDVPANWGLLELEDRKLRYRAKPKKLDPIPLTRHFIASLLRSTAKVDEDVVSRLVRARVEEIRKHDDKNNQNEIERRSKEYTRFMKKHAVLAAAMEEDAFAYQSEETFIAAVSMALRMNMHGTYGGLKKLEEMSNKLQSALADGKKVLGLK